MAMARETQSVPGVIDTLSAGFESINRVLWILLFPIGIDVLLWLFPRLSISQLGQGVVDFLSRQMVGAEGSAQIDATLLDQNRQMVEQLPQILKSVNLLGSIAGAVLHIPSVGADQFVLGASAIEVPSFGNALLLFTAIQLIGIFFGAVYFAVIAERLQGDRIMTPQTLLRRAARAWLSVLGLVGLLVAVLLFVVLPITLVLGVISLFAPTVGALLLQSFGLALVMLSFWSVFYLHFVPHAIVFGEVGPIQALRNSVRLVGQNFWPALGLIGLTIIITAGMAIVWNGLAQQPVGLAVSVVGNDYVMTGLTAASMAFYRNRLKQV